MTEDPSRAFAPFVTLEAGPDDPDTGRMCARSGCVNRLEPLGRRGGRPALYCGDACRAAAHRARTATHTPVLAEALHRTGALSGDLLAAGEQWSAQLTAFAEALSAATTGALTQIDAAEQAAEEARAAAAAAEQRATDAQHKAQAAIAAADKAIQQATAAQHRAEDSERAAWRAAGEHEAERARAQQAATAAAERAAAAERTTRRISSERDALQGVLDAERRRAATAADDHDRQIATLHNTLADRTADLEQARSDLKTAGSRTKRAETAEQKALQDAEAARAETGRVREELTAHITQLKEKLATEREDLRQTRVHRDEARTATAVADARLEALQQALERAEHRAQAAEQREEIAQQTISRLLVLQPTPETASAEGAGAPPITKNFSERP
ncbi:hypothetical protein ACSDR0_45330 [Streptosporangium sp. G11]|uniref:hypothetical protein n=1 Tax=Streptosporangium sp. G11 TaxID=3436926 RepID=UPI003EC017C5